MSSPAAAVRARAALLGAVVADAATMPLHWIYGQDKVAEKLAGTKNPEFFNPPSCPFYSDAMFPGHYNLGQFSPYGEEVMCLLKYMESTGGDFESAEGFADALLKWGETFGGRPNHCTKEFIEKRKAGAKAPDCGAKDPQANGMMKGVVLAVRYYGLPSLAEKVEAAIRVHQNDDKAVEFGLAAAKAVERVILGESLKDLTSPSSGTSPFTSEMHTVTVSNTSKPITEFLGTVAGIAKLENPLYASSCGLPMSYMVALHSTFQATTYEDAIRANIRIGGDNCSRGMIVGALLAGSGSPVPKEWMAQTSDLAAVEKVLDMMLAQRAKSG